MSDKAKLLIARNYVDAICRDDISRVDDVQRDERTTRAILRSYARNISTLAKNTALLADITASGEVSLSMSAFEDYVTSLNKLFVIDNIEAWCPAVRSKTAIRSGIKRAFVDPSIAIAALGLSPEALMTQPRPLVSSLNRCVRETFELTRQVLAIICHTIVTATDWRPTLCFISTMDATPL